MTCAHVEQRAHAKPVELCRPSRSLPEGYQKPLKFLPWREMKQPRNCLTLKNPEMTGFILFQSCVVVCGKDALHTQRKRRFDSFFLKIWSEPTLIHELLYNLFCAYTPQLSFYHSSTLIEY